MNLNLNTQVGACQFDMCPLRKRENLLRAGGAGGVVGDEQHGSSVAREGREMIEDRRRVFGIEVSRRFVGEEELRPVEEGARQRDALALARAQFRWHMVCAVGDSKPLDQFCRAGAGVGSARQRERCHQHIVEHVQVGDEMELLEDESNGRRAERRPLFRSQRIGVLPGDKDFAIRRFEQPSRRKQQGRFSAAARPPDGEEPSRSDGKGNPVNGPDRTIRAAVCFGKIADVEDHSETRISAGSRWAAQYAGSQAEKAARSGAARSAAGRKGSW